MDKPIIGVTERGDPSLDTSWVGKLPQVDGAIIISKNLTPWLRSTLVANQDKCILHASITGYGGTVVERNLPKWQDSLLYLRDLVEMGFPQSHIVVRVDPIIPTERGVSRARNVIIAACESGFKRFRVSVLDGYRHVRERFDRIGAPWPYGSQMQASAEQMEQVDEMVREVQERFDRVVVEACAERKLKNARHWGCVSAYDLDILGLKCDEIDAVGYQRSGCMCYSGKRELLANKEQCPYRCLYCYWRSSN